MVDKLTDLKNRIVLQLSFMTTYLGEATLLFILLIIFLCYE